MRRSPLRRTGALKRTSWKPKARAGPVVGRPALERDEYARTVHQQVLERDGHACIVPWCRVDKRIQVDHVLPRSQGAPDDPAILATLCERCNKLKEDGILIVMPNGDGTFRCFDTRQVGPCCAVCFEKIAAGQLMAVPSRAGAVRWMAAS